MATKKQQTPPAPAAFVDPKFEWAEKAGSYVLRITLPGFRKADLRVQVDGAGRLTVRGTGTGTVGTTSLCKVFQLPSAARHDDIAGRFEAGVLTLTVPKRASSSATAPTSIEEITTKQPGVAKETKPKEEEMGKEDALKKKEATEDASKKAQQDEEASRSKQEQHKAAASPAVKKEEVKPKAPQAPSTAPPQEPTPVEKQEEIKPKAPQAAAATTPQPEKPAPSGSEKAKAAVDPESLAERVRPRGVEEQRAKAAAAAAAEKEACVGGWKERAMGELKGLTNMKWADGLTDMKWADGVMETARKNKEVVAVGIGAFSLGFLVSHKLFRK